MAERVPFAEAISEKLLLKKRFEELSVPQQAALKVYYGLPLNPAELQFWYVSQQSCDYDDLGYPINIRPIPYIPQEYEQAWLCLGRRWGKTDSFSSTVMAYEAALGGHEERIRKGAQTAVCFLVAQDLRLARQNLPMIRATIESSPLLKREIENITADFIQMKNGVSIGVAPPNPKALRGYAVPVVGMDEVGLWYTDAESANPDYEIERAVSAAQGQFYPYAKRLGTSTPWIKEGLLFKYHEAGTEGKNLDPKARKPFKRIVSMHASSAASQNPVITKEWLEQEQARDPEAFRRECLAEFSDAISGFLNVPLIASAVDKGAAERAPEAANYYLAALDPAFRKDAFGFTIVHSDPKKGVVQDVLRRWKATPGTVLNPAVIMAEIAPLLAAYRIPVCYSDQYQLESLQQLALNLGFAIEGVDFTAKSKARIFGSLQQLLNQGRLRLLDPELNVDARELLHELRILERRNLPGGGVQIAAPAGKHDDMAAVTALAVYKATWLLPSVAQKAAGEKTIFQLCQDSVRRKRLDRERSSWD